MWLYNYLKRKELKKLNLRRNVIESNILHDKNSKLELLN